MRRTALEPTETPLAIDATPSPDAAAPADLCCPPAAVGRKCEQLLDGARAVILARGFEGASVDEIAREAGISKATMYRYYPDKAALFAAVMQRDCARESGPLFGLCPDGRPLEAVLADVGARYMTFVISPDAQSVFRTAVHESERFPEIGQAFYASALDRGRVWLAAVLADAAARGEIAVDDVDLAAHRFLTLCKAEVFFKRLFGIVEGYSDAEITARAADAAKAFMRMYRPDRP
jgi:TetR/AcrR family transcriptional repressor of mexJK operon